MPALIDVPLRSAESENQKIAEALPGSFQVVRRVHRPQNVVPWYLPVKSDRQPFEPVFADR